MELADDSQRHPAQTWATGRLAKGNYMYVKNKL